MLLHSPFPLICNMTMFWKSLILTFWPPGPWGEGVCGGNICYHVAAFVIPFKLICNMTMFEKVNFDIWPHPHGRVGGRRGSASKIYATTFQHSWFYLIWYAIWPCSGKVEFWPFDPRVRGWGCSPGKIFATLLLHLCFPLMWYATWSCSKTVEFWRFDPTHLVRPEGLAQAFDQKSRLICFLFIVTLSACEISVKK